MNYKEFFKNVNIGDRVYYSRIKLGSPENTTQDFTMTESLLKLMKKHAKEGEFDNHQFKIIKTKETI